MRTLSRWLSLALFTSSLAARAQVSSYSFAQSAGTYTAIAGGTQPVTGTWDDGVSTAVPIGFDFVFNGATYTTCTISTNGAITFGTTPIVSTNYAAVQSPGGYAGAVCAWSRDLQAQGTAPLGDLRYLSSSGVFTVQWTDTRRYNSTTANAERIAMQIKLYQTTNVVEVVYGTWSNAVSASTTNNGQVGLRGATTSDFNTRSVLSGGSWSASTPGTKLSTCFYNQASTATKPSSGLTYTWTPPSTCSGTPSPGTIPTTASVCGGGGSTSISVTGHGATDVAFLWEESDDNGVADAWEAAAGGTGSTTSSYTTPALSSIRYYRCRITCPTSGLSANTNVCTVSPGTCTTYDVAYSTSASYISILPANGGSGSTYSWQSAGLAGDDRTTTTVPLTGTSFRYQGTAVSGFQACTNGWMTFNTSNTSVLYQNDLANTGQNRLLAPFWDDLVVIGQTDATRDACMRYQIDGTLGSGSAVITIEWAGLELYNIAGPNLNFQVKLYEAGDIIEFIYGNFEGSDGTVTSAYSFTIGYNGTTPSGTTATDRFSMQTAMTNHWAASSSNGHVVMPTCYSKFTLTPGAFTGPIGSPGIAAPSNDNIAGALTLPINPAPCTTYCGTYYTSRNATNSGAGQAGCTTTAGFEDDDVWFTFTANGTSYYTLTLRSSPAYDGVLQVLQGDGTTNIACVNATGAGLLESYTNNGLAAGNYYVRVFHNAASFGGSGQFSLCLSEYVPPPANDNICGAVPLNPAATCTTTAGSTVSATASPQAACSGNPDDDVWYSFVPSSTTDIITVQSLGSFNAHLQVYSSSDNTCTGILTQVTCTNASSTGGSETFNGPWTLGSTYFIRIYHSAGSSATGQFTVCITGTPPACPGLSGPADAAIASTDPTALTWGTVAAATSYDVYFGTTPVPPFAINQSGTSYSATPLTAGTTYYWQVNGRNVVGTSTGCAIRNFTPQPPSCITAPMEPANATSVCIGAIILSWPPDISASSYDVYFDPGTSATTLASAAQTGASLAVGTLPPGIYAWRVVPKNVFGDAIGCSTFTFTVASDPLGNTFTSAIPVTLGATGQTSVNGNTLASNCWTDEYTTASTPGSTNARPGRDVFYTFSTGACATAVTLKSCPSQADTRLHLLDATGAPLVFDDDTPPAGCANMASSSLTHPVSANTVYYAVVEENTLTDGFNFTLDISDGSPDDDGDGLANCLDDCPNQPGQVGSTCDDANASTGNDVINGTCVCIGQVIDCAGVPGGSALPGTGCISGGLPGIWSVGCGCVLQLPDVAVQTVVADQDTLAPSDLVNVSWQVANIGNVPATVNWTERIYMESSSGVNRTLISQASHTAGSPLGTGSMLGRSVQLTMPASLIVGDEARFVVELIPGTGLIELPGSTANNTGLQAQSWTVRKLLKLSLSSTDIHEGAASVSATVQRTGSISAALSIAVDMTESVRFSFPGTVTILAGQSSRTFTISCVENGLVEGPVPATVTASSSGFLSDTKAVTAMDNDAPALSFTGLPTSAMEGNTVNFQLSTSLMPTAPLTVYLTSGNPSRFPLPSSVTIAAGSTSAPVSVNLAQDQTPEIDIAVQLTAGAANHDPATTSIEVTDDDVPGLSLTLLVDTVSESGGAFAVQASLNRLPGSNPIGFTASLSADLAATLLLPSSLSLPANTNQANFTIGVVDNSLVDGFRNVTITAAIQIAGCGCSAPPTSAGFVTTSLVVLDNDGPALSVIATPVTLAEGLANAGALRVLRNTSTGTALTVSLNSSNTNELTLPASASIPIGATYVDVPITTINDGVSDGSQQVYVQASAASFASGISWVIVTDINKPDLQITAVVPSTTLWPATGTFSWQATVVNTGFASAPAGTTVHAVLSQNSIVESTDPGVFDYTINSAIGIGQSALISGTATVPDLPGNRKLLLQVNPDAALNELLLTNNTSPAVDVSIMPSYTATAQVAGTTFLQGASIPVTGTAVRPDDSPAINSMVEVYVLTNGLRREVLTTTDATGAFTATFVPLPHEAGHYTIGASFPGMEQTTEHDAFDILGVRINNGNIPQFLVQLNGTLTGSLPIENLSNTALTDVTLGSTTLPGGASIQFATVPLLAGTASATIGYTVTGTELTPGYNYEPTILEVSATEGAIQEQDVLYYCQAPGGHIMADITSISATVSPSLGELIVQFHLVNNGAGSTGTVQVSLPQAAWLQSVTPVSMPAIAAGDTGLVALRFLPLDAVPYNLPINGTIVISGANANSFSIPFTFTKVAETTGSLTVDVVDQFTFFDAGSPHVQGASVEVRNYYSNALIAQGLSDENGLFNVSSIPAGLYRLAVSKAQHLSSELVLEILPGSTSDQTVFLNYQAITFTWNVVPTGVQDEYDVQLVMEFETNVPMPVVTIEVPDTMPHLTGEEVFAFNATLTNHGLITAQDVTLTLPENDPEYEFITNYVPTELAALQSIQVPVLMRLRQTPLAPGQEEHQSVGTISEFLGMEAYQYQHLASEQLPCKDFAGVIYWYYCSLTTGLWTRGGELYTYTGRNCPMAWGNTDISDLINGNGVDIDCAFCPDPIELPAFDENGSVPMVTERKSCMECIEDLAAALAGCFGQSYVSDILLVGDEQVCVLGATSVEEMLDCRIEALLSMLKRKFYQALGDGALSCARRVIEAAETCALTEVAPHSFTTSHRSVASAFQQITDDLTMTEQAVFAIQERAEYYYGDLVNADSWSDLYVLLQPNVSDHISFSSGQQSSIAATMGGTDIDPMLLQQFFERWNMTITANNEGIYVPNTTYPDILDTTVLNDYLVEIQEALQYALDNGYSSILNMYVQTIQSAEEITDIQSEAVCASVTVQLSQTVTMTREAFSGTLDIFNGHPTDALDSLTVDIMIQNEDGVPSNGLFQINVDQLTNLSDVTGTGMIPAQEHGGVQFLFIPEPGAAPTVAAPYSFGGVVTYWDPFNQHMTTLPLAAVTLMVNPSPDLMLHYFMERNILGDDPLTAPEVEASIPAELAVMVENDGYGPAVNMTISSAQPEIVENESGLAINFELVGSNLQGQPEQLGITNIDFGTIPALQTRIGQWYFTSSLLGKFVSYEASVVHANSFGNPELSLVQGVELHELTRSIRDYSDADDGINDFLVNDIFDATDEPDIIYFSQGNSTAEVIPAASGNFSAPVGPPTFTNTLTLTATEPGWNYIKLDDPGAGAYDLVSVTRQDAQAIPLDNAWLTFVTLPVTEQPVYENKFHIVDPLAGVSPTTYTVVWAPRNTDVPQVDTIIGAPTSVSAVAVGQLQVVFDKVIDPASFTTADLSLTFQGGPNLMNGSVTISPVDGYTFDVDLSTLTTGNGQYTFIAQAADVTDQYGISGTSGRQVSWTQFPSVPAIQSFQGLPGGTTDNVFSTIDLLFNLPIDETSLTPARISVLLNNVPQPGAITVSRVNSDSTLFQVVGLQNVLSVDGIYEVVVDVPNVRSTDLVFGQQQQSVLLTLDGTGPTVAELTPSIDGGLDQQHRTSVGIRFSEPVTGFNTGAVQLTRDDLPITLAIDQLTQVDDDEWRLTDLGLATYPEGEYELTVSAMNLTDAAGNTGSGDLLATWTVDRSTTISITDLGIDPDLGTSDTDGITSANSFDALYELSSNAAQVTVSQVSFGTEQVLFTGQNVATGPHVAPVTFPNGGNVEMKIVAIDASGGSAAATKVLYIDQLPLTANWLEPDGQQLFAQPSGLTIQFPTDLLDPQNLHSALSFRRDNVPLGTTSLSITPLGGNAYSVSGMADVSTAVGAYEIQLDLSALHKASSGMGGSGSAAVGWTIQPAYLAQLRAKVLLQGAWSGGLMIDSLRRSATFPLSEPFTALLYTHTGSGGGETTTSSVLSVQGNDAIVDWVLVELRDASDNSIVMASRSALVQRDGDIVDVDGYSPVTFGIGAGDYHVAVLHRNHLGAMTAQGSTFASGTVDVDLTNALLDTYGEDARCATGTRRALWCGDVNFNNSVQYTGSGNDRDPILLTIGGETPNHVIYGYHNADVNLDGRVKYTGTRNDRDPILLNVGSTMPNHIREGQNP